MNNITIRRGILRQLKGSMIGRDWGELAISILGSYEPSLADSSRLNYILDCLQAEGKIFYDWQQHRYYEQGAGQ